MSKSTNNPVYAAVEADYRPELAWLNTDAIAALKKAEDLGAMGAILGNTPLAGRPLLFTAFLVAMDVLNYQFWDVDGQGAMTRYTHNGKVGALAMQSAFIECWSRHVMFEDSDVLAVKHAVQGMRQELAERGVQGLFGDIPDPDSRAKLLDEVLNADRLLSVSAALVARVEHEDELGWVDAQYLAHRFPLGYEDRYLKKAQLTLMFIAAEWRAMNTGKTVRLDVTAAADYQLPKVLRALGLIQYGSELAARVDAGELLDKGGEMERAIRAATIRTCDAMTSRLGVDIEAVDFWLWFQRNAAKEAKFHLTKTTDY